MHNDRTPDPLPWDLSVDEWVTRLQADDMHARFEAAMSLGYVRDRRAIAPLITALRDPEGWVRQSAVKSLRQYENMPEAVEPVIALLDEDFFISSEAVQLLGQLGDRRAIMPLVQLFLNPARASLVGIVGDALVEIGDKSVIDPLLPALASPHEETRYAAAQVLVELGDAKLVPPLLSALNSEPAGLRASAAYILGRLQDKRAVGPLIKGLQDSDAEVRASAAYSLGMVGDRAALEPIIVACSDLDYDVRSGAASALGSLGDTSTVDLLITMLADKNSHVRTMAAQSLGQLGDSRALPDLQSLLSDDSRNDWDAPVSETAEEAIEIIKKIQHR